MSVLTESEAKSKYPEKYEHLIQMRQSCRRAQAALDCAQGVVDYAVKSATKAATAVAELQARIELIEESINLPPKSQRDDAEYMGNPK